jgi:hypothetical protein
LTLWLFLIFFQKIISKPPPPSIPRPKCEKKSRNANFQKGFTIGKVGFIFDVLKIIRTYGVGERSFWVIK